MTTISANNTYIKSTTTYVTAVPASDPMLQGTYGDGF
jgi:hypothetical protein